MAMDIFHNPVACTSGGNCDTSMGYTFDSGTLGSDGVLDSYPNPRRVYKAFELGVRSASETTGPSWPTTGWRSSSETTKVYSATTTVRPIPSITSLFDFMWSPALADQFKVGPLPTDRRHIGNLYASYLVKNRLNLGLGWNVQSGVPLSKLDAHPDYGNEGEIPVGGRGSMGRSPSQNYTDLRADYTIPIKGESKRIKLAADLFNVFNQKSIIDIDQDHQLDGGVANGDFLKAYGYHRPFYARFSVRFEF